MTTADRLEAWAPWHPRHGFQDQFMTETWVSTDLDEISRRVMRLNDDDGTNNRNGWRAVRVILARAQ